MGQAWLFKDVLLGWTEILYLVENNPFLSGSEATVSAKPLSFEAQSQHRKPGPAASRDGVSKQAGAWAQMEVRGQDVSQE